MALTGSDENINKQVQAENERLKKLIGELTDPSRQTGTERGNPHNSAGQIMILDSFELCLHMASYTNTFTYLPSCFFFFLMLNSSTEAAPTNPPAKIPMNCPLPQRH